MALAPPPSAAAILQLPVLSKRCFGSRSKVVQVFRVRPSMF